MGWWDDQVVPRMVDKACGLGELHKLRKRVCEGLQGDVLEVGFGSGLNISHYPTEVRSVAAVEPSDVAWRIAKRRLAQSSARVVRTGLDGQLLDATDASYDCALSTFTMCTIPDLDAALGEIRRVLKPGGSLHFVEHGLAPDKGVERWQHRLQPIQGRVAGGCHLDRPIASFVERSGFHMDRVETFYGPGPRPFGYYYLGRATKI